MSCRHSNNNIVLWYKIAGRLLLSFHTGKAAAEKVDRLRDASLRLLEQAKLLIQTGDETTAREYLEVSMEA